MDVNRSVCVFCQQAGYVAPLTPSSPDPAMAHEPTLVSQLPSVAAPVASKTDVCAVLSLLFGGLSILFLACMFGPAALLLGVVSLVRIGDNPGLKGKEMAVAGLCIGLASTAWATHLINTVIEGLR